VSQKPVELLEAVSPADLMQAATYLNREFAGRDLADIRREIGMRLHEDRVLYDQLLSRALHLASASLADFAPQSQLFVHGVSTLVDETQTTDGGIPMGALRALLGMIEEKHRMILLLNEYVEGPGLTVVIGAEHNDPALRNVSLVATTTVDEGRTHTIGVLGPTRMRYSRAIAAVETTSLAVGRVLDATP
jgi:heat-inducible transcriptional repressor